MRPYRFAPALSAFALAWVLCTAVRADAGPNLSPSPAPPAAPAPSPTPSPAPASTSLQLGPLTIDGAFSAFSSFTSGINGSGSLDTPNGVDRNTRLDLSDALLTVTKSQGVFRYGFTAGVYNFLGVGSALNQTLQAGANTSVYGPLPVAYVMYAPSASLSIQAGRLTTFTGQESTFTYQNVNIQRGLLFGLETTVSRAVRLNVTGSKFSGGLEFDDGYYSGNHFGWQGQITNTPSTSTTLGFAFVIPDANAPANPTASIANKRLYNPLITYTSGRWTLSPYALWVQSPASGSLGYTSQENAFGAALIAAYALDSTWTLGARAEYAKNGSTPADTSPNANLTGYGAGSNAWTYTLTPAYRKGAFFARAELSQVTVGSFVPGTAFGAAGTQATQFRTVFEAGFEF